MKITIVSSSRRHGRLSPRIAVALQTELNKNGADATILDLSNLDLPPFVERYPEMKNPDQRIVDAAKLLNETQGFVFLTPEYNGAICSSLKNFMDVFAKDPFKHKPIGVATGSTGAMGGIRAAYQLQQSILSIYGYPIPEMLTVGKMDQALDEQGNITDDHFQSKLGKFVEAYIEFAQRFN